MTVAIWCDKGEHPFSAKDPERQHFTKTAKRRYPSGNSYGNTVYSEVEEVTEEIDICGPCYNGTGVAALVIGKSETETLEEKNDDWQAGYDAAINRVTSATVTDYEPKHGSVR